MAGAWWAKGRVIGNEAREGGQGQIMSSSESQGNWLWILFQVCWEAEAEKGHNLISIFKSTLKLVWRNDSRRPELEIDQLEG